MRYLAVYGEARRGPLGSIWHRSRYGPRWHAIFEELLPPAPALCGASTHGSEAQRTWEQVPAKYRCSRCALRAAPELLVQATPEPVTASRITVGSFGPVATAANTVKA